ncbi:MAG: hypothetical protein JNM27_13740 [Leptospirales bacterium]|nr:hypothetical protein [Leptospirales bacterium]
MTAKPLDSHRGFTLRMSQTDAERAAQVNGFTLVERGEWKPGFLVVIGTTLFLRDPNGNLVSLRFFRNQLVDIKTFFETMNLQSETTMQAYAAKLVETYGPSKHSGELVVKGQRMRSWIWMTECTIMEFRITDLGTLVVQDRELFREVTAEQDRIVREHRDKEMETIKVSAPPF